MKVASHQKFTE